MKTSDYQKPLSEICMIRTGKKDANHGDQGGDYLFFTCADKPILSPTYSFDGDSIILPGNGANVGLVLFYSGKFEAYQRTYVLSDFQCDPRYLFHHLRAFWRQQNEFKQFGSATNYIKMQNFHDYQVFLPPLEEQRRIATILDKADVVRRKRQQTIALTEELLRSAFLEMFGDPVTNLKGWEVAKLGDLLLDIESGWSPKCDSRQADAGEWGILKLGAVTWGHFNPFENKALLPSTVPLPELEVKPGDLLFSRKNTYELVGASAFVYTTKPRLLLPDLIFRLRLSDAVEPVYVWQALSRETMRVKLSRLAGGSAGSMPNISKARLRTLPLPVPPLKIQLKYREIVNQFWKKHDHQKASLLSTENLFNSLLQRAFPREF